MAAIVFSLTTAQVRVLANAGARKREKWDAGDSRTLRDLRQRGWIKYDGYSYWRVDKLRVLPRGRAVLAMIRKLDLVKASKQLQRRKAAGAGEE